MGAVTVTRRRINVAGARKVRDFTINIAATGDTLATGLRKIESVNVDGPNEFQFSGEATLVAGAATVADTRIKATDRIILSRKTVGGTAGNLAVGTVTADTSFAITSSSGTDTSVVTYQVLRPSVVKVAVSGGTLTFTVDPAAALTGVKVRVEGN
jgi:hypothetical protein